MKKSLIVLMALTAIYGNCYAISSSISNGVNSIIGGTNITLSPTSGQGDVTVNATGTSTSTVLAIKAGTNITVSPANGAGGDVTINSSSGTVAKLIAGTNITLTPAGGTGNVTIDATGGGLPAEVTFYFTMGSGSDIYYASGTAIPIPGAFEVMPTTITITGYQYFNLYTSTGTSVFYALIKSTCTNATSVYEYITPGNPLAALEVSTNTKYSQWISTNITVNYNNWLALHIISFSDIVGQVLPSNFGVIIKAWRKND